MSTSQTSDDEQYAALVRLLTLQLQRPFTAAKILTLIAAAIRYLATIATLSGLQKKDLALRAVRDVINACTFINDTDRDMLIALVDNLGDITIDTFVLFGQDMITFIQKKGWCQCCPLFKSKTNKTNSRAIRDITQTEADYAALLHFIKVSMQKPIDAPKIISTIAAGVKFLAGYTALAGIEKKDMLLRAIKETVNSLPDLDPTVKIQLVNIIDTFGDYTVDLLVQFGRDTVTFAKGGCKC